ncbi:hypothetical protein [Streptomyces cinereoruber]|uniref:hypothetical protein n=1 Tax=Streptomyces cinereoruber TaxID=67260 RepID=UPI0036394B73
MIRFRLAPVPALFPVTICAVPGRITYYVDPALTVAEAVAALSAATAEYLARGGLIQLHHGEVIALGLAELAQQGTPRR